MADNNGDVAKKRGIKWTNTNEIRTLIYTWEQNVEDLMKLKRNRSVYERMSKELEGFGFYRTAGDLRSKIKNLSAMYRRERSMCARTGNPSEWLYYESIHRFLDQNRLYSEELLNECEDMTPQDTISFSTAPKVEEAVEMVTEKKIKEEPLDDVDIDDRIVLPESAKPDTENEEQNLKGTEKTVPVPQMVIENSVQKSSQKKNTDKILPVPQLVTEYSLQKRSQNQNTEKPADIPQPFVFLLPKDLLNMNIQNVEKIPQVSHSFEGKSKHPREKGTDLPSDLDSEGEDLPSKRRKRSFDDALEKLPLTLQSSILERIDSLSRHMETNTCALSILSKAVNNVSDSSARIVSAVNNLSKCISNIGSTLEQFLERRDEFIERKDE